MKRIPFVLFLIVPSLSFAQAGTISTESGVLSDIAGMPIGPKTEYRIEGSPFLNAEYCLGSFITKKGRRFNGVPIKLELVENAVYYKMSNGSEMVAPNDIDRVELSGCPDVSNGANFQSGFPSIDKQNAGTFYQVLVPGKMTLLKHYDVYYRDEKPYGSASVNRVYERKINYYVYSPQKGMAKMSNNDAVLLALSDKKAELQKYINTENIKVKKEADIVKLMNYYNGL